MNFAERRARVFERMGPDAVLLLPSTPTYIRNNDVEHEYRPDSDLYYLTGFREASSLAVLSTGRCEHPFVLYVRARDPARELWDGARVGVDGARGIFGADAGRNIDELDATLTDLLLDRRRLYYAIGRDRAMDDKVFAALAMARRRARKGRFAPTEIVEPSTILHEMRWSKDDAELATMQRAADISAKAFERALAVRAPGLYEYEIEAELRGCFRRMGSERPAYEPIVASGPNACTLHYVTNDRRMEDGDLLLIDAGAESGGYASDVTRTFPVNGRFSPAQRRVYEAVLRAQLAAIDAVRPGATLPEVHRVAVRSLTESMLELGLLEGSVDALIESEDYKRFYMHGTSHWLGMDVHDVGLEWIDGAPRPFAPGCVLTVEPGLYIRADDERAPAEYRGIGVRIEDDVVVTSGAPRVLTAHIPKDPSALER
ncbi:MAG: aminopeptidase P N-terminal domain-containing protein [Myxococcales bacterium]|nr:aminopeptidase P N-terminal domain-containing protein [Myxococcales bacterium]